MELAYFRAQNSANIFYKKWVPERCHVDFFTYMYPPNNSPSAKKAKIGNRNGYCDHRNMPTATSEAKIDLFFTFWGCLYPLEGLLLFFGGVWCINTLKGP